MENRRERILIADDEKEIRDILRLLLTQEGYQVAEAENGKEALDKADEGIQLYILDVNMPVMSGFAAAMEIRKHSDAPVMFLTAYSGEADMTIGFSSGADDYLVKPFSNVELLLRVRALLRRAGRMREAGESRREEESWAAEAAWTEGKNGTREAVCAEGKNRPMGQSRKEKADQTEKSAGTEQESQETGASQAAGNILCYKDLQLDLDSQSVRRNGEWILLTRTEFQLLELFFSHPKKIFSLENIYQSLWQEEAVGDGAIMAHIKNLRKKLNDSARDPKYIKTAWGKGYYAD